MNYKYTIIYEDNTGINQMIECEGDNNLIKHLSVLFVDGINSVEVHDTDQRFRATNNNGE